MVKIRLTRVGKRNDPFYRIVAMDEREKTGGKVLEFLGYWQPKKNVKQVEKAEITKWVKLGAQVSPTVKKLMISITQ